MSFPNEIFTKADECLSLRCNLFFVYISSNCTAHWSINAFSRMADDLQNYKLQLQQVRVSIKNKQQKLCECLNVRGVEISCNACKPLYVQCWCVHYIYYICHMSLPWVCISLIFRNWNVCASLFSLNYRRSRLLFKQIPPIPNCWNWRMTWSR